MHEDVRLVPENVLVGHLVAFYTDDHDKDHFDTLAGGIDAWEHPIDLGGVRKGNDKFIDKPFFTVGPRDRLELYVGREELA
ncbi:MAG: hypothetical protein U5P41_11445 [Gammaproteobacteria bacterium]|nr:hypothetical protein [Gammaproteobacteria bacterium]